MEHRRQVEACLPCTKQKTCLLEVSPLCIFGTSWYMQLPECHSPFYAHEKQIGNNPAFSVELIRERIVLIYPGTLNMPQVQALLKSWVVISMLVIFLVTSETTKCVQGLTGVQVLLSLCRKNSVKGRVTGKERVYQHGMLMRFTSGQAREGQPENLVDQSFISKE